MKLIENEYCELKSILTKDIKNKKTKIIKIRRENNPNLL